ncbi:zinc-dependent alcohol dehydrogenase family protein [Methylococcus capsulatus]|uniref:zinc-dependent alcohol dehydrogenase family protein n=1 Tax=Methylococcus capsulatus TaxID=414 RepID=UPI001C52F490|nr:zinc-dependent alcohol dehydrogenase family protein [Methylococcus capsulatus]QXP90201.1 zinc-dependent alcohol dehydrogenase family protein [Methylococcus capsulatus]
MKAWVIDRIGPLDSSRTLLRATDLPVPEPGPGEILLQVAVCGVCHTEIDEIEGRTAPPRLPVVPGHQAVGRIAALGSGVAEFALGDRVGVAWIFSACGECEFCRSGRENLCFAFCATGRDVDGGYAQYMTVPAAFAFRIPEGFTDAEAAPLLCAGAIGYRSLNLSGLKNGQPLGLTGFGASAHLVLMMARHRFPDSEVYVFARHPEERAFALQLGAVWAGDTADIAPAPLAAIIDTTPAWKPVVAALANLAPGGRLVVNAIRKAPDDRACLAELDYARHLWMEREIKSVANVARSDVAGFLALAAEMGIRPETEEYPFEDADRALLDLKQRRIRGAKVLRVT